MMARAVGKVEMLVRRAGSVSGRRCRRSAACLGDRCGDVRCRVWRVQPTGKNHRGGR